MQGRQNFELFGFFGKDTYENINCLSAGLSQDIIILVLKVFFVGTGLGIFIWNKKTDRVSSNFTFGEKVFVGIKCGDECVEFVGRHFSNGDLTDKNSGYNFIGVAMVHNF
ncbi:MAG: acyloxyacyl hydrolase [Endomicrobium sp.]|nr:acyloxyacyl hydrolase [Endomicrobium sp.]